MTSVVANRYAKALYELAVSDNIDLSQEMLTISEGLNQEIQEFLSSPINSSVEKSTIANNLTANSSELFKNFISLLANKSRLDCLSEIIIAYQALEQKAKGEVIVSVKSAVPLNNEQKNAVSEFAKKETKANFIILDEEQDKSLIAGFKLNINSVEFDSSVKGRLDNFRRTVSAINS